MISDDIKVEKTITVDAPPVKGDQILGRANYFAHRLSIDAHWAELI